ncbi:hypothetical protein PVAG01_02199 [Phlyctema vagabunda]|uniref:Uncharacterized protein n=1 Tax=Phlyctema vagabunda TaxID=108571 RepID=A0ABR4PQE1_9HELO
MASPSTEFDFTTIEPLLAISRRVLRNVTSHQDLIAIYPSLEQKCLQSPSTLTDSERRQLLDFPDVDMETANISAVTNLSRAQLIEKAVSDCENLTSEEALILKNRFWTPSSSQERSRIANGYSQVSKEVFKEFDTSRKPAYAPNEWEALATGGRELRRRSKAVRDDEMRVKAEAALPAAPSWIQNLYRQGKPGWGFVYFYDGAAQKLGLERLEEFSAHLGAFC